MSEDIDTDAWYVLTDRERIRRLADEHGAVPASVEPGDGERLRLRQAPGEPEQRVAWEPFLERLDREGKVVVYRPGGTAAAADFRVLDRGDLSGERDDAGVERGRTSAGEASAPRDDVETEPIATGDTGDAEPVAFDQAEEDPTPRDERGEPSVAPTQDAARAPTRAAEGLVLDEIHEGKSGPGGDVDDEYLVFENDGDRPVDLSGWTVHTEAGRTYQFPSGTVLAPGERLTLHSGAGTDTGGHRYWNADEPVWDDRRDTVVVETGDGERVLEEPYEG